MEGTEATVEGYRECGLCGCVLSPHNSSHAGRKLCDECRQNYGPRARFRVECKCCGKVTFKPTRREFCSKACDNKWRSDNAHKENCKHCGKQFKCSESDARIGRAYCSDNCRRNAWRQNEKCDCVVCKKQFTRRPGTKDKNLCCSRDCGWKLRSVRKVHASAIKRAVRITQKLQIVFRKTVRERKRLVALERKRSELWPCLRCGKLFRNGRDKLCSKECRSESRRTSKRAGRKSRRGRDHVSRCKEKGLPYKTDLDKRWIEKRDGGVCMLCGVLTVPTDGRRAPTIGHIVPLKNPLNFTHGHTPENTYLNCAACNGKQGNAVIIDGHQHHADPRASYMELIAASGYPLAETCQFVHDPTLASRASLGSF